MTKGVDNVAVALLLERVRRIVGGKMAQQDVGAAFADLAAQLRNVSTFMAARDISNSVSVFEGEPSKFKAWIKKKKR